MTGPGDGVRLLLTVLFAGWFSAFIFAFAAHGLTLNASDGERIAFLGWQGVAGLFAIAVFGVSRQWPKDAAVRRLGTVPILLAALLTVGITAFWLWTAGG